MPFQPAPGTIGVVIEQRYSGQLAENTLYFFQNGADPTVGDCAAIAVLVRDWYINNLYPVLTDSLVGFRVIARNLFVNGGARAVSPFFGDHGQIATEQAPNNVTPVISFDTGQGGKSSHGRNYIPGLANADINVNTIAPTFMADTITAYSQLLPSGTSNPAPYEWAVLSRKSGGITLLEAIAVPVMNVYYTDDVVDSQRRRLPGRGK